MDTRSASSRNKLSGKMIFYVHRRSYNICERPYMGHEMWVRNDPFRNIAPTVRDDPKLLDDGGEIRKS